MILKVVLKYKNPSIITLEYNGTKIESDKEILYNLEKQLNRIHKICNL